jgi:hypothetical protein
MRKIWALVLALPIVSAAGGLLQLNMTTIQCDGVAISGTTRANCTITTRDERGTPTAGALESDLRVDHSPELLDPSPVQGGPIHWFIEFATCKAGFHNVTVRHLDLYNATTQAHVIAGAGAGNFTLDCQRGIRTYVAGERIVCAITTLDACQNPTATPPPSEPTWSVVRTGAALDEGRAIEVLPTYDDHDQPALDAASVLGVGGPLLTSRYAAAFATGFFWTSDLNSTERGVAGIHVTHSSLNFSEVRDSDLLRRPSFLTTPCCHVAGALVGRAAARRLPLGRRDDRALRAAVGPARGPPCHLLRLDVRRVRQPAGTPRLDST